MSEPLQQEARTPSREEQMCGAVLQYLAEHPHAMDTLEGIASWWLMRQQVRAEVDVLAKVLRRLAEQGLLEMSGEHENPIYKLRRSGWQA